jgi:allophanate hydrolase
MNISKLKSRYAEGLTPSQLVAEIYQRITDWNDPALFIHLPTEDELLEIAQHVEALPRDLPLWGIPFVAKDNIDVAHWPTTAACPGYSYVPEKDAEVVRLLREAGAIPIAKGNLDQFATGLVGTRSPYGVARNAIAPEYLPGGSSSGSASSVAAGLCCFSLGTDTAGSGRVPAAFQELIGWKPTRGLLSIRGVVPACRSLDCVSVFANTIEDARLISEVVGKFDEGDPFSTKVTPRGYYRKTFRFGVPMVLDFAGDPDTPQLFQGAIERLKACGGEPVEFDLKPFLDAARLLYEGPWVAERWAAVGGFIEEMPGDVFPVTRQILEASKAWSAADAYRALYDLKALARKTEQTWSDVDFILLPTTPRLFTVQEVIDEPFATNQLLGRYTNFMNLLDMCALALPAGRARDGVAPWGITIAAPAGADEALFEIGSRYVDEPFALKPTPTMIPLAVCGAHLKGLALHWQLEQRGAIFREKTLSAAAYRLYAMPPGEGIPPRPAMIRDEHGGAAIEVEVWYLEPAAFGDFVSKIPGPLGIGKVELASGEQVPGFIAEPRSIIGAEEITSFGGWRAWLSRGTSPD